MYNSMTSKDYKLICQMLKSNEEEMCNLAVEMFCGQTNHYKDYWEVRTMYDPHNWLVRDENTKAAFNRMFNHIDQSTIDKIYKEKLASYRMTSLSSRQKRKAKKKRFKKMLDGRDIKREDSTIV